MKFIKWKIYKASNFYSRFLLFSLLVYSVIFISSCESKVTTTNKSGICIGKPGTGAAGDCSGDSENTNSSPSVPITYDIVCFQLHSFSNIGIRCDPDNVHKISRGAEVTVYLKTETSVQQGNYISVHFNANKSTEKISVSEMESLSSGNSQVYVVDSELKYFGGVRSASTYSAEVNIFDRSSGKFKLLGEGETQELGNDKSKFTFIAGDVDVKNTTEQASEQPKPNESVPNQGSTHPSAAEFIQSYYQLLNERNYKNAWSKLSTGFQGKSPDYKQWWDKVKNIRVSSVKNISQNENTAIVEAQISYELKDGRVKQDDNKQINLIWNKAKNEWEIDK
jgi:hypothetical protein